VQWETSPDVADASALQIDARGVRLQIQYRVVPAGAADKARASGSQASLLRILAPLVSGSGLLASRNNADFLVRLFL
jgi:hypothetical protein